MHNRDIYSQIAQLHAANIDQGFLSTLGTPFLALLYEAIDANESSVLLLAQSEGRIVGFVTGTEGMGPIYRQLLSRLPRLLWALAPSLLSPKKVLKIAEIFLVGKKTQVVLDVPHAELLSIAVDPSQRGQGHAQKLYQDLVQHFLQRGVNRFRIVVGDALGPAHRFYAKMGAEAVGRIEVHQGQASVMYVHTTQHSLADTSA
jgi:ribosomal protein S18 acetylase RimI-like enzyme